MFGHDSKSRQGRKIYNPTLGLVLISSLARHGGKFLSSLRDLVGLFGTGTQP
jgi:hypothetical protein